MHFSKIIAAAFLAAPLVAGNSSALRSGPAPTGTSELGPRPTGDFGGQGHQSGSSFPFPSGGPGGHHSGGVEPTGSSLFANKAKQSSRAQASGKGGHKGGKGHPSGTGFGGAQETGSPPAKPTGGAKVSGHQRRQQSSAPLAPDSESKRSIGSTRGLRPTGSFSQGGAAPTGGFGGHKGGPSGAAPSGFEGAAPTGGAKVSGHQRRQQSSASSSNSQSKRSPASTRGVKPTGSFSQGGAAPTGGFGGHKGGPSEAAPSGFGGAAPTGGFGGNQGGFPSAFPSGAAPSGFGGAAPTGGAKVSGHQRRQQSSASSSNSQSKRSPASTRGVKPTGSFSQGDAAPTGGFGGNQGGFPSAFPSGAAPSGFGGAAPSGFPSGSAPAPTATS